MIHEPMLGNVLVELETSPYGNIPMPKKSHDSLSCGKIVAVHPDDKDNMYLVGRVGWWHLYKDDVKLNQNLAVIEIKDILATSKEK